MKKLLGLCGLMAFLFGFKPQGDEKSYVAFKPHMRAVYQSLMSIFPFALNRTSFADPKNAKLIQENLQFIANHATQIQLLSQKGEKGHVFLSRQLEQSAQQADLKFKAKLYDQSQFFVEEMYDTCLGCHTSRGSEKDSAFTLDFAQNVKWDSMGPFGKARFFALSRQFEKALSEYEILFAGAELSLEDLLHYDPVVDYMLLALRVKDERQRVIKTFDRLLKRQFPTLVKKDIEVWRNALSKLKGRATKQSELDYALFMIQSARGVTEYPRDRSGLVYYIYASRSLHEFLKIKTLDAAKKAEAYYELGVSEMGIGVPFLSAESALYFEEAIRLVPKTSLAKKAYALYEESITFGYSGSSGVNLPDDEKKKLDELRALAAY